MPGQSQSRHLLHVMTIASIVVVPVTHLATARVTAAPAPAAFVDEWDTFTADVSIQQATIAPDGVPVQPPPPDVRMRMERSRTATGWRMALTLEDIASALVRTRDGLSPLDNPFLVTRLEYDGDGTPLRFYNRRGDRVSKVKDADIRLLAVPDEVRVQMPAAPLSPVQAAQMATAGPRADWMDNVIAMPARRDARRQALEARYGAMRGRVNGLDQYIQTTGDTTAEVLVNGEAAVPVEVNVARGRDLVARTTFAHEPRPGGVLVRRLLHAERLISAAKGTRAVADVGISNVVVSRRGIE